MGLRTSVELPKLKDPHQRYCLGRLADTGFVYLKKRIPGMNIAQIIRTCLRLGSDLDFIRPHLGSFTSKQLEALLSITINSLRWKCPVAESMEILWVNHLFPRKFTKTLAKHELSRNQHVSLIVVLAVKLLALESRDRIQKLGSRKK